MFELWYSNRLENLIDALAAMVVGGRDLWYTGQFDSPAEMLGEVAARRPLAAGLDPLESVHVVVPNWNLQRHLQFELARRLGVAANLEFDRLRRFLSGCLPDHLPNERGGDDDETAPFRVLNGEMLHSGIFELLGRPEILEGAALAPVREYLGDGPAREQEAGRDEERVVRRFQLAERLASLFEDYAYARPEMVEEWKEGPVMGRPEMDAPKRYRAVEQWQRRLWLALFDEQRGLFGDTVRDQRFALLPEAFQSIPPEAMDLPDEVHIFGLSYVAYVYRPILSLLAEHCDVYVYALNPCREFWEDLRTGRRDEEEWLFSTEPIEGGRLQGNMNSLREALTGGEEGKDGKDGGVGESLWVPEGENPALRLWGRPGRDHVRMLGDLVEGQAHRAFRDPLEDGDDLLHQLQRDILLRRPEEPKQSGQTRGQQTLDDALQRRENERPRLEADESVQFLACTGIQREVETIANEIWRLMRESDDGEGGGLRFNDFAVIVNERQRQEYVAQLESVFDRVRDIPYNVVDLPASGTSRVVEALEMLLELPFGEFQRSELLRLLVHPNVIARYPEVDAEDWVQWCDRLNIVLGADREALSETYIDLDVFNWDQGLKRLLLGEFMSEDGEAVWRAQRDGAADGEGDETGEGYLPEDISPEKTDSAARMVLLARSIIEDARWLREAELSLERWGEVLGQLVDTYLGAADDSDEATLARCRRAMVDIGELDVAGTKVGFRAAREFAGRALEQLEVRRGQYLADGVVVSSFLPMRPIPFEHVFVTGLGEDTFPAADPNTPLDLRTARWQPGDVGPRDQDRYMFLETLISTRRGLYLSWVARDASTGEALEPSSVVREVQYVLEEFGVDPESCTRRQPLRRHAVVDALDHEGNESDEVRAVDQTAAVSAVADAEAHQEAKVAGVRRELAERCGRVGAKFPDLEALREHLDEERWERLRGLLKLPDRGDGEGGEEQQEGRSRLQVSISQLRGFLASPLQGGARASLGLREEDEEDALTVEHEPFEVGILQKAVLLREVFRRAALEGVAVADIAGLYRERIQRAALRGDVPAGLFLEASRGAHLHILDRWKSNLGHYGLDGEAPMQMAGFGQRAGPEDEGHPAVLLEVEVPLAGSRQRDGASRSVTVEIHGRCEPLVEDGSAFVSVSLSGSMKPRYLLKGLLSHVVGTAAGVFEPSVGRRVVVNPNKRHTSRTKKAKFVHNLAPLDVQQARAYLRGLLGDLIGGVHDYLMPVEMVHDYVRQRADGGVGGREAFARLVAGDLEAYRSKGAYRYGPIDDYERFPPAGEPEEFIRRRFAPLYPEMREVWGTEVQV